MDRDSTTNSATYRAQGYDAGRAGDYAEAARLYQLAADAYPIKTGALAKRDIDQLRGMAASYRAGAEYKAKLAATQGE